VVKSQVPFVRDRAVGPRRIPRNSELFFPRPGRRDIADIRFRPRLGVVGTPPVHCCQQHTMPGSGLLQKIAAKFRVVGGQTPES
jgi:hypothetical protein